MRAYRECLALIGVLTASCCFGQAANQIQLKIDSSNRTIAVSAEERVTMEPEIAILHIGFVTPPSDAKQAYAAGSKASNQIISALKGAGLPDSAIRSESQSLESWDAKAHRYQVRQSWAVRVPPSRVAEILDIAVNAGATDSGQIEWTVENETALEDAALEKASERARSKAASLAKGMGAQLGKLVYVSTQAEQARPFVYGEANFAGAAMDRRAAPAPLAIEPHKVSRSATVYAVFAIE